MLFSDELLTAYAFMCWLLELAVRYMVKNTFLPLLGRCAIAPVSGRHCLGHSFTVILSLSCCCTAGDAHRGRCKCLLCIVLGGVMVRRNHLQRRAGHYAEKWEMFMSVTNKIILIAWFVVCLLSVLNNCSIAVQLITGNLICWRWSDWDVWL